MKRLLVHKVCAFLLLGALTGCSSAPYAAQEGTTEQLTDGLVEYGGPAALGTGGFFAGKAIGGSTATGVLGAIAGLAVGIGFDVFANDKRKEAYNVGRLDGADEARAEQSLDLWKREAVYNAPGQNNGGLTPRFRTVYVPSRNINGVAYPGGYQEVEVYP